MAINPQIPLMARPQIDPTPGLGIQYTQQRDAKAAEAKKANELRDLQIKEVKAKLAESGQLLPVKQAAIDAALAMPMLSSGRIPDAIGLVDSRIKFLEENGLDAASTKQFRALLESDPQAAMDIAKKNIEYGGMFGFLKLPGSGTDVAQETELINGALAVGIDDSGRTFAVEIATNKRLEGPEAQQRIQQEMRAERQSELKQRQAEADIRIKESRQKETDKKDVALDFNGLIEEKVQEARSKAKARGEALTELEQMEAALPELRAVVGRLKELSEVATHTITGRAWNAIRRELGFGATEGGEAMAEYISIVANQVLPLLKPTFGGSFTVQEGAELKSTMGDPKLSPAEKIVQLDAFIAQKERNVRSKSRQVQNIESRGNDAQQSDTNISDEDMRELELLRQKQGQL
jgi:hypothetical protein